MKVICIDKDAWPEGVGGLFPGGVIVDGNNYNVYRTHSIDGYKWFELREDLGSAYWENCFIQTSEIDETEMVRESLTEKV